MSAILDTPGSRGLAAPMIDLRQLRYFVAVAEDLHFHRAAERLHIAQPALSMQIKALEQQLGVRLLARSNRSVSLTPAGTLFLEAALLTLSQAQHAEQIARQASRAALHRVAIGYSGSVPVTGPIRTILQRFTALHPDVELTLTEIAPGRQMEDLQESAIDFSVFRDGTAPRPLGIRTAPLLRERYDVAMASSHRLASQDRIALSELADEALIAVGTGGNAPLTRSIFDMCRHAGFVPRIAHTVWQVSPAVSLAAAGLGVAVVPHSASEIQIPEAVFRPLAAEDQSLLEFAYRLNEGAPATLALIREAKRYANETALRDLRPAHCETYAAE